MTKLIETWLAKLLLSFYSVEMPIGLLRSRARRISLVSLAALALFTLAQTLGFAFQGPDPVIDPEIGAYSISLNIISILIALTFYVVNFVLARRMGWHLVLTYRISIYIAFTLVGFIAVGHMHIAGTTVSVMPMMCVDLTLLNCWLTGPTQAWVYFFIVSAGWILTALLERSGYLTFMPIHLDHERVPLDIFLDYRYITINAVLFLTFGSFII